MSPALAAVQMLAAPLVVGLLLAGWDRRQKRRFAEAKRREERRYEGQLLQIELEVAAAQLSYAVAMAYRRGRPNGELESAVARYEKAMGRFRAFENAELARTRLP